MNTLKIIAAITFGFTFAGSAMAQAYPHQECWVEDVAVSAPPQARSNTGAVIGGVAGGIIGNQVGGGQPASQGTRGIASFTLRWGATKEEEPAHSCAGFFECLSISFAQSIEQYLHGKPHHSTTQVPQR